MPARPASSAEAASPAGLASPPAGAQEAAADTATLRGRVVRGGDTVPVADRTVVLHRVEPEGGSPVDSVRTGPEGRFAFRLVPTEGVVHLASARYDGVLYLGPAVHGGQLPSEYLVRVWEARPATPADTVRVRRRTLVLTSEGGALRVMDVADVSAGTERTLAPPAGDGSAWWGVRLPAGVRDVRVLPGGVDPSAVEVRGGEVRASADIPPRGVRLVLGYRLPEGRALALAPGPGTGRLEVVARGVPGELSVRGLRPAGTSTVQGQEIRRWTAAGDAVDTVRVLVAGGGGAPGGSAAAWIALAVGVLAAAGAILAWRAGSAGAGAGGG